MAVRIGHVRAKDNGIKEGARRLLALVRLELFGRVLEYGFEERPSRTVARAIEY